MTDEDIDNIVFDIEVENEGQYGEPHVDEEEE